MSLANLKNKTIYCGREKHASYFGYCRADSGGEKTSAPCVFHCPVYLSGRRRKSGDEYVFPMGGENKRTADYQRWAAPVRVTREWKPPSEIINRIIVLPPRWEDGGCRWCRVSASLPVFLMAPLLFSCLTITACQDYLIPPRFCSFHECQRLEKLFFPSKKKSPPPKKNKAKQNKKTILTTSNNIHIPPTGA